MSVAYFTGHASPKFKTLREQTAGLCRRYDELFAQFGLKKENIISMNAYLKDIKELPEFDDEWNKWIDPAHAPAGVAVQAPPDQTSEMGDNIHVELALIVAADCKDQKTTGKLEHFDLSPGGSRLVIHNDVAYFTGHVSPFFKTLREQTEGICRRYDELFTQFGLKKENILMANIYVRDGSQMKEFSEPFHEWVGEINPPAGIAVQAPPEFKFDDGSDILIEIALIVARA
ncbi:MAG: Rid family hydrolase [Oscillospiraceae bacterium]